MLEMQRAAFLAELPVSLGTRSDRLRRALTLIEQNSAMLCAALERDHEHQDQASAMRTEVAPALAVLRHTMRNLPLWMRPTGGRAFFQRLLQGDDYYDYQPIGVVGVAAAAELPLLQLASLLAGALAAGNRVVVAFDPASRELQSAFASLAARYFEPLELTVASDIEELAGLGTDSGAPGSLQSDSAPQARSSKSPVIIGRSADFANAAERVVASKLPKAGRMPLAPDYLLVPEDQEEAVANWLFRAASRFQSQSRNAGSAISDAERQRLDRLISDARARGGEVLVVEPPRSPGDTMPLHIIRHATQDMLVMQDEVRGPILPLCNYRLFDEAIEAVHRNGPPLAIYYLGRNRAERQQVLDRTLSTMIALDGRALAMGDAGSRGLGSGLALGNGQGEAAFHHFSHARHVYRRPLLAVAGDGARAMDGMKDSAPALL